MALYISLMRLTQKGLEDLKGSPARRKVSEKRVAALGGKSLAFYATLGKYDFVQLFEMPNNASMMEYVLAARKDGYVDPLILPAFDTDQFGEIVESLLADKAD